MSAQTISSQEIFGREILKYRFSDFEPIDELVRTKRSKALKIALGIPTLNEEDNLERTIEGIREQAVNTGLVDRIAVFDSSSTDGTEQVAKRLGVEFHRDRDIAQRMRLEASQWRSGKGFNLWASVSEFKDYDIVGWVDADIKPEPRFTYGILGPLINNDEVMFSKGTYVRPNSDSRVSRYTVDPVLGLLFPEAEQVSDPLCGIFAGKRSFLEKLPFYSGYAVEVGTLIHALNLANERQIAQVNLGELQNREHPDAYLGKMGTTIAHAMLQLAEAYGRVQGLNTSNRVIQRDVSTDQMGGNVIFDFKDIELPPIEQIR